jgi:hypothetical protein
MCGVTGGAYILRVYLFPEDATLRTLNVRIVTGGAGQPIVAGERILPGSSSGPLRRDFHDVLSIDRMRVVFMAADADKIE